MKKTKLLLSGKIKYIIILHSFWPVQFKDQPRIRFVVVVFKGRMGVLAHFAPFSQ